MKTDQNPFQSPRAKPKHASHQVNGETEASQTQKIIKVDTKNRM